METLYSLLLVVVILWLIYWMFNNLNDRVGLPPGPRGLPLLGYYPFLGKQPLQTLNQLKSKYGAIFGLFLGRRYCVVLADVHSLREANSKEECLGRPPNSPFSVSQKESVLNLTGGQWTDVRRFSLRVLRDLGFGKMRMENVIENEIHILIEEFERQSGPQRPELFGKLLKLSIRNVIYTILFGQSFSYTDPRRRNLDKYLETINPFHNQLSLHTFFPWLGQLFKKLSLFGYSKITITIGEVESAMRLIVDEHERTLFEGNVRDYVDAFLLEGKNRGSDTAHFSKDSLIGNLSTFLRGGSGTTTAVLEWSMFAMAIYPEIQDKVYAEIQEVTGGSKPTWPQRQHMPYTIAVLMETQRWRTVVPNSILKYTTRETNLQGYRIPAGTIIIQGLWLVHNDPQHWENPEGFRPERMLTLESKAVIKNLDSFVSFSTGRRSCPGEPMANMQMFLYFTSLLQRYHVTLPEKEKPDMQVVNHITCHPKNLRLILSPRG